ncbi:MAG: S8 family serine peptidase [Vicinamibacteria bacterium]|nr:S8 family serine peptidase [Vicinamibacteria bacterium]
MGPRTSATGVFRATVLALALHGAGSVPLSPAVRADDGVRVVDASRIEARAALGPCTDYASRVVVQFKDAVDDRSAERCVGEAGGARATRSAFGRRYVVEPMAGLDASGLVARLRSMPEVAYAEPDGLVHAHFSPNDSLYRLQWHLKILGTERMWDIQKGDPSVAVAVLDTGVAYEDFGPFRKAPDFGGTVFLPGYNVFTHDTHANDDNFHGTHVASIIAEATNNGDGASGIAYQTAIMPVKVLDADGFGANSGIADAIDYVVNFRQGNVNPVRVINLSLGGSTRNQVVEDAIRRAVAAGITVVASAGNDNAGVVDYPAAFPDVIAVGSVDYRKVKAPYSSYGADLDLVAPGGDNRRDDNGDGRPDGILQQTMDSDSAAQGRYDDFAYYFVVGTSQAAPQVSALAALLSKQGVRDPKAIQALMEKTAEDLGDPGRDDRYGWGLIRPAEALKGLGLGR